MKTALGIGAPPRLAAPAGRPGAVPLAGQTLRCAPESAGHERRATGHDPNHACGSPANSRKCRPQGSRVHFGRLAGTLLGE